MFTRGVRVPQKHRGPSLEGKKSSTDLFQNTNAIINDRDGLLTKTHKNQGSLVAIQQTHSTQLLSSQSSRSQTKLKKTATAQHNMANNENEGKNLRLSPRSKGVPIESKFKGSTVKDLSQYNTTNLLQKSSYLGYQEQSQQNLPPKPISQIQRRNRLFLTLSSSKKQRELQLQHQNQQFNNIHYIHDDLTKTTETVVHPSPKKTNLEESVEITKDQFKTELIKLEKKKQKEQYSVSNLVKQQKLIDEQNLNFRLDNMERIALINDFLSDDNTHIIRTPQQNCKIQPSVIINPPPRVSIPIERPAITTIEITSMNTKRRPQTASKSSNRQLIGGVANEIADSKIATSEGFNSAQKIELNSLKRQVTTLQSSKDLLIPSNNPKPPLQHKIREHNYASKSINLSFMARGTPKNQQQRTTKIELCQQLEKIESKNDQSIELLKNRFCKMYAKIQAIDIAKEKKCDKKSLILHDQEECKKQIFVNISAKIKDKNKQQLVNAIEDKFKRVIKRSQSRDVVSRMIEVIDKTQKFKHDELIKSIMDSPDNKPEDISKVIQILNESTNRKSVSPTSLSQRGGSSSIAGIVKKPSSIRTIAQMKNMGHSHAQKTKEAAQDNTKSIQEYRFTDNMSVEQFFKMQPEERCRYKVYPSDLAKLTHSVQTKLILQDTLASKQEVTILDQQNKLKNELNNRGFWFKKQLYGIAPVSRENGCLYFEQGSKQLFVCGGYQQNDAFDTHDISIAGEQLKWQRNIPKFPLQNNYGQLNIIYQDKHSKRLKVLLFGGQACLEKQQGKAKYSSSALRILDLYSLEQQEITMTGDIIRGRKNMGSCFCDQNLIIHGGQDNQIEALGDFFVFNVDSYQWRKLKVTFKDQGEKIDNFQLKLSHHTMTAVSKSLQSRIDIYIFGGLDSHNAPQNQLYLLTYNTQSHECKLRMITDKTGFFPQARSHHSALMTCGNKYLLIYGGKNDFLFNKVDSNNNVAVDDIALFNTKTKCWDSFGQYGFKPDSRWNTSIAYDEQKNRLILFSGSNLKGFCTNDIYYLEMQPNIVQTLISRSAQCQKYIDNLSNKITKNIGLSDNVASGRLAQSRSGANIPVKGQSLMQITRFQQTGVQNLSLERQANQEQQQFTQSNLHQSQSLIQNYYSRQNSKKVRIMDELNLYSRTPIDSIFEINY
ncbi:kelch motif family protein [Stylonychia lemnae]|uniref:Kelch motif family protein n=1 Tax=Stylonychia lemnae TaxID=5949 RepID=A0A077ZZT7_STYLE|nr:kelch motif family protein [Stylonychia lemnae]|eukprot:CDW74723.1 kelch motif family protein [Stylonychia lemnae]